jgi:hypothetical protein
VADTTRLQFLVSGNNQFSRINIGCPTAAEALKKGKELVGRGYMDVRICTPRGQILLSDEFHQLKDREMAKVRGRVGSNEREGPENGI